MNAEQKAAAQKEDLRHAVLDVMVFRHPAALTLRAIRRHVAVEIGFTVAEEDVAAAAELLVGLGHLAVEPDPLGSTKYYRATPAGVLAQERGR
jgi:hypothetical protein